MSAGLDPNETEVGFVSSDGWALSGIIAEPAAPTGAGVVLVPGSLHERDAFVHGRSLPGELAASGIASLRFDIRGRGMSLGSSAYHDLAPLAQANVRFDITAAVDVLIRQSSTPQTTVGVLGEQDTANAVVASALLDDRISALALLSPRLQPSAEQALLQCSLPVFALVSREDRLALRSATRAYLAGLPATSTFEVFSDLGFGTTMFAARAYVQPGQTPLETMIAQWFTERLTPSSG